MKNNKKKTRMTKVEKRRLAFEKRNVKKEQNLARYGAEGGSTLVMAKTVAFNRRVIAAVLAIVFVLTSVIVGFNIASKAEDPTPTFDMLATTDKTGLVLKKGLKDNGNGTYDLQLEAYATESALSMESEKSSGMDIIIIADRSDSMVRNTLSNGEGQDITRLAAMKSAIEEFSKEVARHANNEGLQHRIAIMGPDDAEDHTNGFLIANESSTAKLNNSLANVIDKIDNHLTPSLADDINKANQLLEEDSSTNKKIIIIFTDGVTNSDEQNRMAAEAATAKTDYDATIYAIGVPSSDEETNTLLSRVSSNYTSTLEKVYATTAKSLDANIIHYYKDSNDSNNAWQMATIIITISNIRT